MTYKIILLLLVASTVILCPAAAFAERTLLSTATPEQQFVPLTGVSVFTGCKGDVIGVVNPDFEQAVVEQTNLIRREHNLPPLKRVPELDESARYHAADMSYEDYFNHNSYDRQGELLYETCDTWERIENYYPDWAALAENIAAGQRSPDTAMEGWMNSPDHRHNILSDGYWEIGVGYYEGDGLYQFYWDQNFGKKMDRYPVILELEAAQTPAKNVDVYVYGEWDKMRLKVNNGDWSQWFKFEREFEWTLPDLPGLYTVTVEMTGSMGSATSSDSIQRVEEVSRSSAPLPLGDLLYLLRWGN